MGKQSISAIASSSWENLLLWLDELLLNGFASVQAKDLEQMAGRMVDLQMGGIARIFRQLAPLDWSDDKLTSRIAADLLDIKMAGALAAQYENLNEGKQASLLAFIVGNQRKPDEQKDVVLEDQWLVLKVKFEKLERVKSRIVWFFGQKSHRIIYTEDFVFGLNKFEGFFQFGSHYHSKVALYPAIVPYRAQMLNSTRVDVKGFHLPQGIALSEFIKYYSEVLAEYPINYPIPVLLGKVTITRYQNQFFLQEEEGDLVVPLQIEETTGWNLMSVTISNPIQIFVQCHRGLYSALAWISNEQIMEI
ncbi:MAG: hypothetical protein ABIV51_12945 [Saprospiraceae bacterium]